MSRVIEVGVEVSEAQGYGMFGWADMGVDVGGSFGDNMVVASTWGKICVEYTDWIFLNSGVNICEVMGNNDVDLGWAGVTEM